MSLNRNISNIYKAVINCDATASATVFVMAESDKKAPLAVLDIASELPYTLTLNTPYAPEFWLERGEDQVEQVIIETPGNQVDFDKLEDDAVLAWPENADQPHTKADFMSAAFDNSEWAFRLYDAYIKSGEEICLGTYLQQIDLKDLIFGSETNYQRLSRVLSASDLVRIDDGPFLSGWGESNVEDIADNQVFQFSWSSEGLDYGCNLTEEGIAKGTWESDKFLCKDHEGEDTVIEFFTVSPLKVFGNLA